MQRRLIQTEGLRQSVLEQGGGPLVLLCHGFPELAYSWRAQIPALAAAGYRVVAPDMRGYGRTDRPEAVEAYTILHLVGDMVDLVRALGETQAVIIGHDWGAPVAWAAAQLRPDIFRAVAGLSVPFRPRVPGRPPVAHWRDQAGADPKVEFYMVRFQRAEVEAELEADIRATLTKMFTAYDGGTAAAARATGFLSAGAGFVESMPTPSALPAWLTPESLETYVAAFTASGFRGPLAWYRNIDRNHALTAFAQGRPIDPPAYFMVGEVDPVRGYMGRAEEDLVHWARDLRGRVVVQGAGHWLQQERPEAVNAGLIDFLKTL